MIIPINELIETEVEILNYRIMKKYVFFIVLFMTVLNIYAQKKDKIKGNKIIVKEYQELGNFKTLEISDNVEVKLTQGNSNSYILKTDKNLVEVINFKVVDDVLKIYTSNNITSSKKLIIYLTINNINSIVIRDDVEFETDNQLKLSQLSFTAYDKAKFELDLSCENSNFNINDNASGKFVLIGKNAEMNVDNSASLKGEATLDSLNVKLNEKANLNLKGNLNTIVLNSKGNSDLKANNLISSTAAVNISEKAAVYLYVSKLLVLYAEDDSVIRLIGNPELKIDGLNHNSQIIKK